MDFHFRGRHCILLGSAPQEGAPFSVEGHPYYRTSRQHVRRPLSLALVARRGIHTGQGRLTPTPRKKKDTFVRTARRNAVPQCPAYNEYRTFYE